MISSYPAKANRTEIDLSPEGENPWDLVPDQPKFKIHSRSNSKTENNKNDSIASSVNVSQADKWLASLTDKISVDETHAKISWAENNTNSWNGMNGNHVEDPLEMEWTALANRNVSKPGLTESNNTNPFRAFV